MLARAAGLFALLAIAACNGNDDLLITTVERSVPPTQDPAHNQGKSCIECHTNWNLVEMHDAVSGQFNGDCISCHGDMTDEKTLSETVKGIHPAMMPWVLPAAGQAQINNELCAYCHPSVDFLGGSAGNLLSQVAITNCTGCHRAAGPGNQLYR